MRKMRLVSFTFAASLTYVKCVEAVVMQWLLPSLGGKQIGVEGLRIYLLLTELLHVIQKHKPRQSTELAKAVAAGIQRLPAESLQVLENWWSSLERSTRVNHVNVWKQALSVALSRVTDPHNTGVRKLLQVLQHLYNDVNDELPVLCCFPFVMDLQSKKFIFDITAKLTQEQNQVVPKFWSYFFWFFGITTPNSFKFFELKLKRASLLEGTLKQLGDADHRAFKKPLVVCFDVDPEVTDVYKKDFFHHLFNEMASTKSGMFMYNDSKTLAWFPSGTTLGEKTYFLFGVLCGLALYNQIIIHLPFPTALFKKLIGVEPSLEDMVEFSPVVGRTLLYILEECTDDDIENLYMDFSNTVYEKVYHKSHSTIRMFWEVFEELTEDQQKDLLFVTGFDKVPILGMDKVRMTVRVLHNSTDQHFPEAHTCFSVLELPLYSTKEILKARLTEALSHRRGFFE